MTDLFSIVLDMVELAHPVEEVVHAGQVWADADVVVLHGVLATHRVETWKEWKRFRGRPVQLKDTMSWVRILL